MTGFSTILLAAAAAAETGAYDAKAKSVFPPLDMATFPGQLFWLALTFGLLFLLLWRVFLPRLGGILEERSSRIADDLDSAASLQRQSEMAEKAYTRALADAKAKAHSVAETTRASVNAEIEAEIAAADAEAEAQMAAAETKITAMRDAALANVNDIAQETTGAIASHILPGKVSAASIRKAVAAAQ